MDSAEADALVARGDSQWAGYPPAVKELVRAMLLATPAGDFGYVAGAEGTADLPEGSLVASVAAVAPAGTDATVSIDGGDDIVIPAGGNWSLAPAGALLDPAIVFTDTESFFVEVVT